MQRGTSYCAELMRPIYCMLAPFLKTRKVKVDDTTFTAATPELGVAFQRAAAAARDASGLSVSMRLRLYGLYKQATAGDAAATAPEASVLDPTAQPKWRSWSKLRGMPRAEAMRLYVAAVDGDASEQGVPEPEIDPEEEAALELMGSGMGGGVMSMMAREDGDDDDDDDDEAAAAARCCARRGAASSRGARSCCTAARASTLSTRRGTRRCTWRATAATSRLRAPSCSAARRWRRRIATG